MFQCVAFRFSIMLGSITFACCARVALLAVLLPILLLYVVVSGSLPELPEERGELESMVDKDVAEHGCFVVDQDLSFSFCENQMLPFNPIIYFASNSRTHYLENQKTLYIRVICLDAGVDPRIAGGCAITSMEKAA